MHDWILTVTLNPSIDVSSTTETVTPEHKLRCTGAQRGPGGGGINVARVLRRLGVDCRALFPAGGALGQLLERLLAAEGLDSVSVPVECETRESFTVIERSTGREYRFVLPGPRLTPADWGACLERAALLNPAPGYVIASGSLPPGVPDDFYARMARLVRERDGRMIVDASGPPLAYALQEGEPLGFLGPFLQ